MEPVIGIVIFLLLVAVSLCIDAGQAINDWRARRRRGPTTLDLERRYLRERSKLDHFR